VTEQTPEINEKPVPWAMLFIVVQELIDKADESEARANAALTLISHDWHTSAGCAYRFSAKLLRQVLEEEELKQ
jgi:hypothetical protein